MGKLAIMANALKNHPLFTATVSPVTTLEVPEVKEAGAKRDPYQSVVKKVGLSDDPTNRDYSSPSYTGSTMTLDKIEEAWNKESYVRRSVSKYTELMFKAGWDLVGKNPSAVQYLKTRFAFMAECTQQPTDIWLLEQSEDLVKYSNVVMAKLRKGEVQWPKGIKVQGIGGRDPILGYSCLPVKDMQVKRDKVGTVKGWQQDAGDKPVKFKAEDIVHIYYQRERGKIFGTPSLVPVLDDIISLRQAEENVLKLIYRNLFPFLHYKIGTEGEHGQPGDQDDVDKLTDEVENMELEGGLVTTERVNIEPVALDQVIDAYSYLLYFERRVFTGLGVSESQMGRGATSARATAENMTDQIIDSVKALQRIQEAFLNELVIKELLLEGGFDPLLNPNDDVRFLFKEIDVDMKIKKENHAIFQYEHNAITEDEMRILLGRDPVTDRGLMFCNVVTIPVAQATADAKAEASPAGNSGGGKPAATTNKVKPTNKAKTKTKAGSVPDFSEFAALNIKYEFSGLRKDVMTVVGLYHAGETSNKVSMELAGCLAQTKKNFMYTIESYLGPDIKFKAENYFDNLLHRLNTMVIESLRQIESPMNCLNTIASFFDLYDSSDWDAFVAWLVGDDDLESITKSNEEG